MSSYTGRVRKYLVPPALLFMLQGCVVHKAVPTTPVATQNPVAGDEAQAFHQTSAVVDEAEPEAEAEGDIEGETVADEGALPESKPRSTPKIELTDEQIAERAKRDPSSLGTLSLGQPARGSLVNGIQMPRDPRWRLMDPVNAYGTRETIDYIALVIGRVNEQFQDTPPLPVGDISSKNGGPISPHHSHQAGRDVDLNYYLRGDQKWYKFTNANNIDLARSWALIKALMTETEIEYIFIDTSIQKLLADYAQTNGESREWVDSLFQVRGKNPAAKIRHVKGHATHLHVRFFSPVAQELGRRAERYLPASVKPAALAAQHHPHPAETSKHGTHAANTTNGSAGKHSSKQDPSTAKSTPAIHYVMHRARSGDVLVNLAHHYGTTVDAIQQANNLKGNSLKIGQVYKIPVTK